MSASGTTSFRKRVLSTTENTSQSARKRPRISSISANNSIYTPGGASSIGHDTDRLPRLRAFHDDDFVAPSFSYHPRPLSVSSSFTAGSRAASPGAPISMQSEGSAHISRSGMALMRSVSCTSIASTSASVYTYPESSAKHNLRNTKVTIDFSMPAVNESTLARGLSPLSCSPQGVLFFSRGNRVHYKNLTTSEDIGQLCRLQESHGDLRMIECGGTDQPDVVALGTSKGLVHIWDVKAKKMTASWTTKGVSAMRWNGPVLTLGGLKGTIRHYDTRIAPTPKMKEQARKVTRHQMRITSLAWNIDGNLLASGDESGTVYCWDSRQKIPLDVGDFVQRRKKIQHLGAVSALAWSPWQSKLLATGGSCGIIHLWNINASSPHSNATVPGKLELDSPVTGLHFSPHCKELLSTHGANPPSAPDALSSGTQQTWGKKTTANSLAVHSFPSLRCVETLNVVDKAIGGGVMAPSGTKIVLAVPEDNKLHVCDVWAKRKELKRQPSFMSSSMIR